MVLYTEIYVLATLSLQLTPSFRAGRQYISTRRHNSQPFQNTSSIRASNTVYT